MSIPEEVGKVASSAVDGLKGSPGTLGVVILAGMFSVLTFFALQANERREYERSMQLARLLQACFPSGGDPIYPPRARRD